MEKIITQLLNKILQYPKQQLLKMGMMFLGIYTVLISVITSIVTSLLLSVINFTSEQKTLFFLIVIGIGCYFYFVFDWSGMQQLLQKGNTVLNAVSKINNSLPKGSSHSKKPTPLGEALVIHYTDVHNKEHRLVVPYTERNMHHYTGYRVIAEFVNDGEITEIDITHQPGIKYHVSPSMIYASRIFAKDNFGNVHHEVTGDQIFQPLPLPIFTE